MNKTVHQIECRDDIWKRVEALAQRRGVSTDEIVQAALIQLFTRKKTAATASDNSKTPAPAAPPSPPPSARPSGPPAPSSAARASLPRPGGAPPGPPASSRLPPPSPRLAEPEAEPEVEDEIEEIEDEAENRPLYLWFEGNWYTIDQEQYVIGRGSKFSDLPIKDANISRRHCAVMRRDGEYYMTDLGSTNGIEFAGVRVDNHLVEEGNVYYLCDHELRFSFQSPY